MTRDDIIRMAREAGFRAGHIELYSGGPLPFIAPTSATDCMPELERFASLVASSERDAILSKATTAHAVDANCAIVLVADIRARSAPCPESRN